MYRIHLDLIQQEQEIAEFEISYLGLCKQSQRQDCPAEVYSYSALLTTWHACHHLDSWMCELKHSYVTVVTKRVNMLLGLQQICLNV